MVEDAQFEFCTAWYPGDEFEAARLAAIKASAEP
jgi:hypothetical protein